ncbi:voltage-dependent calcium channel subunit alpha-2/delta-3-like isoform X2 [Ptychodera flava]|uniref:voltage-dependent calcium channel subunit alpha-2/delta-3-like isoform X2 n=1 Tax=Ptychodera flava TaxID=63121 RepID=UPI003969EC6B
MNMTNTTSHHGSNAETTGMDGLITGLSTPGTIATTPSTEYEQFNAADFLYNVDYDMQLRTAMVNRTTGSLTMEVKLHLSNLQRATTRSHSYYYTDLKDTPFSLGIVLVNDYGQFIIEPNLSLKEGLKSLTEKPITLAAARQWIYCRLGSEEAQVMSKLERIVQYVNATETDDEEYIKKCNPDLIKQVLFDANMTLAVEEYWEAQFDNKESNISNGIVLQFVGTHGGLTRSNYNKMSRTPTDFLEENSNTIQEDYYTRAVELGKGRFLYSVPIVSSDSDIEDNNTLVTASSVVMVQEAAVAVAGIQFRTALLEEIFNNVTESCNGEGCRSCSELDIDCYLLDNSGYVVMSESTSDIGRAFSKIDGIIAADLSKEPDDIYRRIFITDFQAMCENADPGGSSASFLLDPFFSVTAYFNGGHITLFCHWYSLVFMIGGILGLMLNLSHVHTHFHTTPVTRSTHFLIINLVSRAATKLQLYHAMGVKMSVKSLILCKKFQTVIYYYWW